MKSDRFFQYLIASFLLLGTKYIKTISLFLTALFIFTFNTVKAQQVGLHIYLRTGAADSLVNTSIQIYTLPDSILFLSAIYKPGTSRFLVNPFTRYLIRVSAVDFETAEKIVFTNNKPQSVTIELKTSKKTLKTVTVISQKPLIKQEDDKTVVDAEVLANSSTNAYEVLEKTPGLVMDQDGNVYLTSTTAATIYINGRQMRMSTDDIVSLLKNLPAGSISSIEIIRTPSAKYDATNSGGIVNVILKKGIRIGTTGSMNLRYDQGVYSSVSAGLSINHSAGKINSFLSYQYTRRNYFEDIESNRLINLDTLLSQASQTRYRNITHYIGGGIDVEFTKKMDLAYDLRLTTAQNYSNALSANDFSDTGSLNEFYQSQTPITINGHSIFIANTVTAKYKLDSSGSAWVNELAYTYSNSNSSQKYTNNYISPPGPADYGNGTIQSPAYWIDFKSDLSVKLKYRFMLETGFKISDATNHNKALYFLQTGSNPGMEDPYQTDTFTYRANINAAYLQLSKAYKAYNFKAGIRFENTYIAGHQIVPADTSFYIKRNDLFPYLYIKRPLFKILGYPLTGNAIYRRSITRPGYDALNPSPRFIDPFTYNIGNPKLQPQFTTNYEINSTYNDFPVFALGVNNTKDVFSPVTYQNDTTNIAYRTFDNLGRFKEIYGRLFGGLPAGGRYFMYAGVQYNHIQYTGEYQGLPLHYERGSWTFFTGHELKATPTLKFNLNAWMYANGFRAFNELKTLGQLNMSVTKSVLDKKLAIILSGNDLLRTNKSIFHLQQGDILVNGTRTQDTRRIGITMRFNFGLNHKEDKKELFNQQPVDPDLNP